MKILIVGPGEWPMYDRAFFSAANKINDVEAFHYSWENILSRHFKGMYKRSQNKLSLGPDVSEINSKLAEICETHLFDLVFLYSCRVIFPKTIKRIKKTGAYIACYCNDDPFSLTYSWYYWRHWKKTVSLCDITYVYRKSNIEGCQKLGANRIKLLRSYYIEDRNYYIPDEQIYLDVPDVIFMGHYEKDEREDYLLSLANRGGIKIGVTDMPEWEKLERKNKNIIRIKNSYDLYNEILNKAKIAIVFLSKINHDTYTRRCFEIPVTKTLMVCQYTEDISMLYREDKEAVFFRNKEEFLDKILFYLNNKFEREAIAERGYKRTIIDGHGAIDRVKKIINDYKDIK